MHTIHQIFEAALVRPADLAQYKMNAYVKDFFRAALCPRHALNISAEWKPEFNRLRMDEYALQSQQRTAAAQARISELVKYRVAEIGVRIAGITGQGGQVIGNHDGGWVKGRHAGGWVPGRDPNRFPVCPMCKEIYEGLRAPQDGGE